MFCHRWGAPYSADRAIEIEKLCAELTDLAPRTPHHIAPVLNAGLQAAVGIGALLQINPAATVEEPTGDDSEASQALEQDKLLVLINGFRGSTLFEGT